LQLPNSSKKVQKGQNAWKIEVVCTPQIWQTNSNYNVFSLSFAQQATTVLSGHQKGVEKNFEISRS
jgi:hypothetical protein